MARINLQLDGQNLELDIPDNGLPVYITDSAIGALVKGLEKSNNENTKQVVKAIENQTDKNTKTNKEESKKDRDTTKEFTSEFQKNFRQFGNILQKFTATVIGSGIAAGTFVAVGFKNLGEGLKTLTDVGGAFGDTVGALDQTAIQNIISLNKLGFTTDEAVGILVNFSRSASVLGQSTLVNLNKQFLEATNFGRDLGVTLDDATSYFQEDLQFRTAILLRDQINQAQVVRNTETTIKNLRQFSTLLGISADELEQQAKTVIDGNDAFKAFAQTQGAGAEDMVAAAQNLATGLTGMGAPQEIINGILSIAATGVGSIDDIINEIGVFSPELRETLIGTAQDLRSGALGPQGIQGVLRNISSDLQGFEMTGELRALIDAVGGDLATAGNMITAFGQSADLSRERLSELGIDQDEFDATQQALIEFQNITKKVTGTQSTFINSMVQSMGGSKFTDALKNLQKSLFGSDGSLTGIMQRLGSRLGDMINNFLDKLGGGKGIEAGVEKLLTGIERAGNYVLDVVQKMMNAFQDGDILSGLVTTIGIAFSEAIKLGAKALVAAVPMLLTSPEFNKVMAIAIAGAVGLSLAKSAAALMAAAIALKASAGLEKVGGITGGLQKIGGKTGIGGRGAITSGVGRLAAGTGVVASGLMVGKDLVDVVAGTDGGATGENIGGTIGGALGAIGFLAGPIGGAIGIAAGNMLGNWIGGKFDKPENNNTTTDKPESNNTTTATPTSTTSIALQNQMASEQIARGMMPDTALDLLAHQKATAENLMVATTLLSDIKKELKTQTPPIKATAEKFG